MRTYLRDSTLGAPLVRFALPIQTVDATPSDIKLFLKVVFMKQGRRFGFSAEQKLDVGRRWKAGQTLHEIGRAFGNYCHGGQAAAKAGALKR